VARQRPLERTRFHFEMERRKKLCSRIYRQVRQIVLSNIAKSTMIVHYFLLSLRCFTDTVFVVEGKQTWASLFHNSVW